MKSSWTHNLEEQRVKDIAGDFKSSLITRKRLVELLEAKIGEADTSSLDKTYDNPNWALKQADYIGYKRALKDVINLITE